MRLLVSHVGLGKINNQLRFVELARNPPKSLCFLLLGPLKSPHPDNGFTPFFFNPHLRFSTRIPQNVFQNHQLAPNPEFQLTPLPPSTPSSRCIPNYRKHLNNRASGSPARKTPPSATGAQHGKATKVDFCKFGSDCERLYENGFPCFCCRFGGRPRYRRRAAPFEIRPGPGVGAGRRGAGAPGQGRAFRQGRAPGQGPGQGQGPIPYGHGTVSVQGDTPRPGVCRTSRRKVPEGAGPITL